MATIVRSYPARDDLQKIWLYIARDSVSAADRMIDRFEQNLVQLAENPMIGQSVGHFRPGLRQSTVGRYALFYEPIEGGI